MKKILRGLQIGVAVLAVQPGMSALTEQLTDRDISSALALATGPEAARTLFHAAYILPVKDATIEQFEVITEYRRFVLAAEDELKAGNWMMARGGYDPKGRSLKDLLKPSAGQVSIRARLRFHPQNSYVMLPIFDILVGDPSLLAVNAIRTPHVAPSSIDRNAGDYIYGATIETAFNALSIADRVLTVRIVSDGKEYGRAVVDFARLE
ncbi:MAG TPA: hypothetical protein VL914_11640 [Vicinamibacterales bacterium]|nr:hypothetical protein [Vicinamibacterales bacterium]